MAVTITAAVILHIPVVLGIPVLFPPATDNLSAPQATNPINLIEEAEDAIDEPKQIVSLDKPDDERKPEKATVLDRYNQSVDKQTIRKRKTRPSRPTLRSAEAPPRRPRRAPPEDETPPKNDSEAVTAAEQVDPAENIDDKEPPRGATPNLTSKEILPSMDDFIGEIGDAGFRDYLDIPEGEKDLINRKQTRYWSFFDRMKRGVKRQWRPNRVYQVHDPRRQVYGVQDRLTVLKVILTGDGTVKHVMIEKPSGVPFLDSEARRAFTAASPFPNPPEGLKDANGRISLRFGFFLDVESRGTRIMRFRR
jgi:TonB family protein